MNAENKHLQGFSLIELMVVVAVIAALAAIAIPSYKNYLIRSRVASLIPVVDSIISKSIEFSLTNGAFGNAYDLGYNNNIGFYGIDNAKALSPYFSGNFYALWVGDYGNIGARCGAAGEFGANLDPLALGIDPNIVDNDSNIGIECGFWNERGVINKMCSYWYGTNAAANTGNLIALPGWFNQNSTESWSWDVYESQYDAVLRNATCP